MGDVDFAALEVPQVVVPPADPLADPLLTAERDASEFVSVRLTQQEIDELRGRANEECSSVDDFVSRLVRKELSSHRGWLRSRRDR